MRFINAYLLAGGIIVVCHSRAGVLALQFQSQQNQIPMLPAPVNTKHFYQTRRQADRVLKIQSKNFLLQ
jgi:hypothetical protein